MRGIIHTLLAVAVAFGCVVDSKVKVEINHAHEVCGGHGHQHVEVTPENEHHHHEDHAPHDHHPAPQDEDDRHPDDNGSHHHSHEIMVGVDAPVILPVFSHARRLASSAVRHELPDHERCPDGPCYKLIKPPQLG